jgi:hypothetical protein
MNEFIKFQSKRSQILNTLCSLDVGDFEKEANTLLLLLLLFFFFFFFLIIYIYFFN